MTVRSLILALGGTAAVARALNTPVTTVHTWSRRDHAPAWRLPALLALAAEKGVDAGDLASASCAEDAA